MQKRLTVSIPPALHVKMQKWKKSINYSSEFRRHISRLIEKKERFQNWLDSDMGRQTIERLKREKTASKVKALFNKEDDGLGFALVVFNRKNSVLVSYSSNTDFEQSAAVMRHYLKAAD